MVLPMPAFAKNSLGSKALIALEPRNRRVGGQRGDGMGTSKDRSRFQYRDTYPSAFQAKIHAPDQRLTAFKRRWTFSQITVANRDYHYLSRFEIAGDKRISQHLSRLDRRNHACRVKDALVTRLGTLSRTQRALTLDGAGGRFAPSPLATEPRP